MMMLPGRHSNGVRPIAAPSAAARQRRRPRHERTPVAAKSATCEPSALACGNDRGAVPSVPHSRPALLGGEWGTQAVGKPQRVNNLYLSMKHGSQWSECSPMAIPNTWQANQGCFFKAAR
eukprot:1331226-Pleurochrysis_carterae.AAC.1